eukprot:gene7424-5227_t
MLARSSFALERKVSALFKKITHGSDCIHNKILNKGTAFSAKERAHLKLDGLLPPAIESLEDQVERCWTQVNLLKVPINQYQVLRNVQNTNSTLFYAIVAKHLTETLPLIYTPTVGEACQKYGNLYHMDSAMYLGRQHQGKLKEILQNSGKDNIDIVVITDGSRILGLGDLGANGVGISIGKCSLYVAAGGVHPARVLPVVLDVGTNNTALRENPLYLGLREPRIPDADFYALLDEFMEASNQVWPSAVIQFEDFSNNHCFDMLERYQSKYRCFNDDIQGTGAVIAAGFLNAIKLSGKPFNQHKILFFGAGSAAAGVADSILALEAKRSGKTVEELRQFVYFVDSKGLVTDSRGDKLAKHKLVLARKDVPKEKSAELQTLEQVVTYVKPTALIGLGATGGAFTEKIVRFMASYCDRPIIFPLSNPSSKAEILPSNAYKWTNGGAIVASGSPFPECKINGKTLKPSQGNNLYVFPGIGLACALAQPKNIPQEVLITAAASLSTLVSEEDLAAGQLYPPIEEVRAVSRDVAAACVQNMQTLGICTNKELPKETAALKTYVEQQMWTPAYIKEEEYLKQIFF